ncbi:MAG: helix-turn-helix transcriptional regulator [Sphingomicrobium sp.]
MDNDRYLTASAVADLTTLSRATIERKVRAGDMPPPIYISERRKAWKESSIRQWMSEREAA